MITYEPFPVTDREYARRLHAALRPGGLLVIESFASDTDAPLRRPVDIDPPKLRSALEDFEVVQFEDVVAKPDWDPNPSRLARAIARKK